MFMEVQALVFTRLYDKTQKVWSLRDYVFIL